MSTEQLLVLIAQNDIKDDIVDTLIELEFLSGFSLGNICGFSREHSHFNIKEQVEGYRDMFVTICYYQFSNQIQHS